MVIYPSKLIVKLIIYLFTSNIVNQYLNIEIIITPFLEPRVEARIKLVTSTLLNLRKKTNINITKLTSCHITKQLYKFA